VLIPIVSEANKNNDVAKLKQLYQKSSLNQLIVGGLLFLGIWSNIDCIFQLIPHGDIYIQGKWVVFFIGMSKLFDMAAGINAEIIGTSRYYKIDLFFFCFLSIFGIVGNMIFIPLYQMTGAAIASAISVFLFNTMRFLFLYSVFRIQPFSFKTLKVLGAAGIVFVINRLLPTLEPVVADIVVRSALITIVFGVLVIGLKISEDINALTIRIFSSIRSRFS